MRTLIADNFFLPVDGNQTLYSHRTWEYMAKTEVKFFSNGHCFHGSRSVKLTKNCLKALFLESLMKE